MTKFGFRTGVHGLALAACSVFAAGVSAQTGELDSGGQEPILVTGDGLPDTPARPAYDTQTLEREVLVTTGSGRLEDALASVAGFQQFRRSDSRSSNPSAQGITLRALGGNATSRALVLLDGVPMADPFFGYIPFSAIAPERLESARVSRGGGSGPFGAGALAGVIELTSAGRDSLEPFSAKTLVNNRGETAFDANASADLGSGFATVGARWDRGMGFHTTPREDRVEQSARAAYESWSVQLRGVAPLGEDLELQARTLIFDDRRTLRFDGADSSSSGQDASVRIVKRGDWEMDALAYVQARNFSNIVVSSTRFVSVLDQRNTPSTGLGAKLEVRPPLGNGQVLRIGVDYRKASGELYEDAYSAFTGQVTERRHAGGMTSDFGLFIEHDWALHGLVLTAGARADRYAVEDGFYRSRGPECTSLANETFADREGWDFSARGGALYGFGDGFSIRAAAYTGLRLPTLNELYRPFVVFPVTTRANAELSNERLEGYEIGMNYASGSGVEASLTAFDNRVENAVANVTLDPVTRQRRNIEAIAARGVEASVAAGVGPLRVEASLAYTDAEARQPSAAFDGNRPAQTPQWAGGATVSYKPYADSLILATLRHVGVQFEDDLQTDALPAATTIDAFAKLPLSRRYSLILRGENLTGETIVTRNQGGSIDLGTTRTVWAGLSVEL
ncbi:MAG: TonB-dependent receptor [Citromicrobium sp.]|nr:MAG: TonB-dependent receptor [Citromicrobium sp.]